MATLNLKALLKHILSTPLMIDDGTEDIWHYRKWSNGEAECWARQGFIARMITGYGTSTYYTTNSAYFPTGLFKAGTQPVVVATRQGQEGSGIVVVSPYVVTDTYVSYFIANMGVPYDNAYVNVSLHVYGVWK